MEKSKGFSLAKFVEHVVPRSVVEAMATNEILQLVVFSVFFGIALTAIGKKGEPIINALDSLAHVVLKMVTYVMYLAPLGVFGAMAAAISKNGLGILRAAIILFLIYSISSNPVKVMPGKVSIDVVD